MEIVFLTGPQYGGVFDAARALAMAGASVGLPRADVASPQAVRNLPHHDGLWYWQAVRRYFDDYGLPPIAPVPPERITPEAQAYYSRALARTIARSAAQGPFICVDPLTSLILPLLSEACALLPESPQIWYFYRHPAKEIYAEKLERGQPPQLTEFCWRNMAATAVLYGGEAIRFIDMDAISANDWQRALDNIAAASGQNLACAPPPPAPLPQEAGIALSDLTIALFGGMRHFSATGDRAALTSAAQNAYDAQRAQDGWQFYDCLDCGTMHEHGKRLLMLAGENASASASLPLEPDEASLPAFIDGLERELMRARDDYEAKLFLHSQALAARYRDSLLDARRLHEYEIADISRKRARAAKRRKARIRKLFEMAKTNADSQVAGA